MSQATPLVERVRGVFAADGPLTETLSGFVPRVQQVEMAAAVAEALTDNETLVVEAGTGVGKTFAYLLPALASGGKVIVSTGTKNLQDQLFRKDLPVVRRALRREARCTLLKGRSNYLCRYRLRQYVEFSAGREVEDAAQLRLVDAWSRRTPDGDTAGLASVPEQASIWPKVTSTAENCLGQECPDIGDCHVLQARRAAQEADVVVINHHLFFADLALKEEGFGEILPSANAFILDEAHQLPEVASNFFGMKVSSRVLSELARDTVAASINEAPDQPELRDLARDLEFAVRGIRSVLAHGASRQAWDALAAREEVTAALDELGTALQGLQAALAAVAERGRALQAVERRARAAQERLARFLEPDVEAVRWCETHTRSFSLNLTPLDIAGTFAKHKARYPAAWVFTSATLAVGDDFTHFNAQLGLASPRSLLLGSPFDYARQALIYRPQGLPQPNTPGYTQAVVAAALPIIEANSGGTFLLFTSHRALQAAAGLLAHKTERLLLVQGGASRRELLEQFREAGNAVLLGAQSFWEGVDVQGDALACVVMDKLPFAAPDDPLLKARSDALRAKGGNPFRDVQLPRAVIAFKQGVGRLIRDIHDRGVLIVCDPRLDQGSYGSVFRNSLPAAAPVTRDEAEAVAFFAGVAADERSAGGVM
ncbi:ATP-dependent DNA helicase [Acidihalobacter ferrooxydans]|uniref:Helicase n=1 Tax=Acidihalobacter ferrooxydans TaxID=1765967 RepID=A0A1P8UI00_9GAMM|nr:ATP-dependent DNA helicase [Acidihalobacter ferrooxydans]APZ43449.1 helicase [Acidihalobacter ferrooxydans]